MSGGGGSQTQTQTVQMPAWLQNAAKENLERGRYVSQLGYVPNYGMDVAAFSPMQTQAMQNTGSMAQAFGLAPQGFNATAGIPQAETNNLGFSGYRSGNLFDESLNQLAQRRPAQYEAINDMFVNPQTGALGTFFTPDGSIGTNALNTNQTSAANMQALNQLTDQFSGNYDSLGLPTQAQDWNKLSPEMQKLTMMMIPAYGAVEGISKLKQSYDQYQADKRAAAAEAARSYDSSGSYDWSQGAPTYSNSASTGGDWAMNSSGTGYTTSGGQSVSFDLSKD